MGWSSLAKFHRTCGIRPRYDVLFSSMARICQAENPINNGNFPQHYFEESRSIKTNSFGPGRWGFGLMEYGKRPLFVNGGSLNIGVPCGFEGKHISLGRTVRTMFQLFGSSTEKELKLNRDFFVQLWVSDKKMNELCEKRKKKVGKQKRLDGISYVERMPLQRLAERLFSGNSTLRENSDPSKQVPLQPPPSQPVSGLLKPASPNEARVAPLLARSNLVITRDIEWKNLVLGFEQENRYAVMDVCYPQTPVGFIREQSNVVTRQLLRLRRPFVAYITDAIGNELFRVRRPFWWITSSIYVEIDGKEVGVVHRRWHLWRRVYDLYLGNKQFAVVENPGFWNWTFTLKDINGEILAEIDRDWRGFGFELFTDAGQYVIRFGSSDPFSKTGLAREIEELEVARPLTLSERAVTLALAISLDNDYFSRHGGWAIPFVVAGE